MACSPGVLRKLPKGGAVEPDFEEPHVRALAPVSPIPGTDSGPRFSRPSQITLGPALPPLPLFLFSSWYLPLYELLLVTVYLFSFCLISQEHSSVRAEPHLCCALVYTQCLEKCLETYQDSSKCL